MEGWLVAWQRAPQAAPTRSPLEDILLLLEVFQLRRASTLPRNKLKKSKDLQPYRVARPSSDPRSGREFALLAACAVKTLAVKALTQHE